MEKMNCQTTCKMPKDLVDRIDRLAQNKLQGRASWIRQTIIEKVREEEAKFETLNAKKLQKTKEKN